MIKLFKNLKPFKVPIILVLVLVFFQSLSELYLPTLMSDIVNNGIVNGDTDYILKIGAFMLLVALGGTICTITASFLSSKVATGFGRDLRKGLFTKVEGFSIEEFDKLGTSSLITRTTNDITQVQQVLVIIMRMMISAPMMCIGGIIMAVSKDRKLSIIIVVVIPILIAGITIIARKGLPLFKSMQIKLDKLNLVLREGLTGIRVIRAFNRNDHERERFNEANYDLTSTAIKVNKLMAILMPLMMLVMNFTTIAIIWFGAKRIDAGNMQVGDLMAFIQYVMQIMFSLIMVSMMFIMIPRASVSASRINEVLDIVPVINDPKDIKKAVSKKGYIEFKNVSFNYPGSESSVIRDISFSASPGETTAIIGGTGSGKSTIISLIPRFYDINSGSILINGVDLRDMSQEELRSKIGFVPQKAVLFTGTISDNIRYGKEDATEDEIKKAANIAQATDFISNMEEGFNSVIAQGGTNVSGGQKQRLSIARALVRRPEIYIFDDSFSALDFKTDAKLRAVLKDETKESTVIIVAQRVSTVIDADRIIVLDEGNIVGMGTHKELLNSCDVYHEIVSSQLSEEEIA
ncbi:ABC transporter ATP-binding protein [Clostridium algidicarnis]|uniref:ABC transporter ATP-binding protein n=1 Tax=Clostridium algidicarnis TaxID=37659 RepID=UPI001C0CB4D2|nr:ABC transporter ATP-binding protein [Clostridium algidicarnis]MBU3228295.1 ABC transporter ATP-binding protein/permease [Clostridium algidicarnis]MBU3251352.1 ABC transporter ATP-binding protein/permease [Clostridium algidicarnis]